LTLDQKNCKLYETYYTFPPGATWTAGSGAVFDLAWRGAAYGEIRPQCWTSADAAGLPILAGLVRRDEVLQGEIKHALRFTAAQTQKAFIPPATHYASTSTSKTLPPMGLRMRMKSTYDCSAYTSEVQVICRALKKYGMLLADNGSSWFISGTHDMGWNDARLADVKKIPGSAFEAVYTGEAVYPSSCP